MIKSTRSLMCCDGCLCPSNELSVHSTHSKRSRRLTDLIQKTARRLIRKKNHSLAEALLKHFGLATSIPLPYPKYFNICSSALDILHQRDKGTSQRVLEAALAMCSKRNRSVIDALFRKLPRFYGQINLRKRGIIRKAYTGKVMQSIMMVNLVFK
jgi:hypothetical protein